MLRLLARSPAVASLRHRNFRLFLGGQFLSLCGTWIQQVAHGWLVLTLTDSALLLGLVSTLGSLPILLFTLIGGVVADRVDKRKFIILLQSLMLAEALALGILTAFGWVTVGWVMVLAVCFGLFTAFEVPTRQAFVVDLVGRDDLINAIALNSSAFNVARVVGPAIAGATIAAVGIAACFFLNAASFVAVLAGLLLMRVPAGGFPTPERREMRAALAEGFTYVLGERWPRTLIILTAVLSVFGYSFLIMLPVFARDALGTGAAGYGGLLTAVGVGAAVSALGLAAMGSRVRQGRLALASGGAFGLLLLTLAVMPNYVSALAVGIAAGCTMALSGIATNTLLQRLSPDHLRGRVMGFYSFVALGMAPFGSLQAGWVAEHFGVRMSFAVGGFLCMATVGIVVATFRRLPQVGRVPTQRS